MVETTRYLLWKRCKRKQEIYLQKNCQIAHVIIGRIVCIGFYTNLSDNGLLNIIEFLLKIFCLLRRIMTIMVTNKRTTVTPRIPMTSPMYICQNKNKKIVQMVGISSESQDLCQTSKITDLKILSFVPLVFDRIFSVFRNSLNWDLKFCLLKRVTKQRKKLSFRGVGSCFKMVGQNQRGHKYCYEEQKVGNSRLRQFLIKCQVNINVRCQKQNLQRVDHYASRILKMYRMKF